MRRKAALRVLKPVGAKTLGEWHEDNNGAYHIRRRLTVAEQRQVGEAVDLRGTDEAETRLQRYLLTMAAHPNFEILRRYALRELE